jgi:hypothetical protein
MRSIVIMVMLAFVFQGCAPKKNIREGYEWADFFWRNEDNTEKPRVLFIGNSIVRQFYTTISPKLEKEGFNCDRYSSSRSIIDPALYQETKIAMAKYNHAIIYFNNGLHGWHLNAEQYGKGLRKYVKFLKSKKTNNAKLVFALTTPWPSDKPETKMAPRNQNLLNRNRVARKIMKEHNIPVIDLYGLVEPELEKYSKSKGDVHYNEKGIELMSAYISNELVKLYK